MLNFKDCWLSFKQNIYSAFKGNLEIYRMSFIYEIKQKAYYIFNVILKKRTIYLLPYKEIVIYELIWENKRKIWKSTISRLHHQPADHSHLRLVTVTSQETSQNLTLLSWALCPTDIWTRGFGLLFIFFPDYPKTKNRKNK